MSDEFEGKSGRFSNPANAQKPLDVPLTIFVSLTVRMFFAFLRFSLAWTHTVKPNQTLFYIAAWHGTTTDWIIEKNNITNPRKKLAVGQKLIVGEDVTCRYKMGPGDSVPLIALLLGSTEQSILKVNNVTNPYKIKSGDTITVVGRRCHFPVITPLRSNVTMKQLRDMGWHSADEASLADLNECIHRFHINTTQSLRHFIAQCSHESRCGLYREELQSGSAYEGRADLGNVYKGDGKRFKGAGYIQLTGRTNYQAFSDFIGDKDVMKGVKYVAKHYPWTSAGFWWQTHGMTYMCNLGATVKNVTRRVNGAYNGLADRQKYYERALMVFV